MIIKSVISLALLLPSIASGAISLSLVENFSSPTTWTSGSPNPTPPVIRENFGPAGTGDSALLVVSSVGSGPGSRLITFDQSTWTGNYSGQGVTGLRMDLRNTGTSNLFIRIAVNGPGGWFVSDGHAVDAGLGYANFLFDLSPAALNPAKTNNPILGTDRDATLASVTEVRIIHNTASDSAIGAEANASLRIDNITAVPEPKTAMLFGLMLTIFIKRKR